MPLEHIKNVHFSGAKIWDGFLPGTQQEGDQDFAERLLATNLSSYHLWFTRQGSQWEYEQNGCELCPEGGFRYLADGADATPLVDGAVERCRQIAQMAVKEWRCCYERMLVAMPGIAEALREPALPSGCPWPLGAHLEVEWGKRWHPVVVYGIHADGTYVVRWQRPGVWGDTERNVPVKRLRDVYVKSRMHPFQVTICSKGCVCQ